MIKKILYFSKKFYKINFRFDLPIPKKILLFDETHSLTLRKIIKKNFNVLKVRNDKEIYFWIFLKQIFFFDFKFMTYCKNYIKYTSPKIIITFIDTNLQFYELKNYFNKISFISIQNGVRVEKNTMFYNKLYIRVKKLKCDYVFVFNKYYIQEYKRIINSNFQILGNFKNNIIKIRKKRTCEGFLFISQFNNSFKKNRNFEKKLMNFLNLYFNNNNIKLFILLRNKDLSEAKKEINFYKKILKNRCEFIKTSNSKKPQHILDEFENIICMYSTLGFEAIARKKKVVFFSPIKDFKGKLNFAWPAPYKKKYDFFSAKKLNYNETERVLNNVKNCSQSNWERKYYSIVKDQLFFNKNNTKLAKVINKLLKK